MAPTVANLAAMYPVGLAFLCAAASACGQPSYPAEVHRVPGCSTWGRIVTVGDVHAAGTMCFGTEGTRQPAYSTWLWKEGGPFILLPGEYFELLTATTPTYLITSVTVPQEWPLIGDWTDVLIRRVDDVLARDKLWRDADLNKDGRVGQDDFGHLQARLDEAVCGLAADLNHDCRVDGADVRLFEGVHDKY